MKQRTLLLTLVALLGIMQARADVTINATNFPDENFRNWLLEQYYGSDGVITDDEIAEIKEIYVINTSIASLKGIEFFKALTGLYCFNNQLTSLDVSKNTALKELACHNNQLTSLDVSKNTALTVLSCFDNQLTSLDMSGCTALTELHCYNNQLTSLDVSGFTALTTLRCYTNQLTSLDVSKNTLLTELSCDNNQLTSLNVSGCTALKSLYCYNNQLTSLNVSGCTALKSLYCHNNQLTSLDVSKNTALIYLACSDNQLASLDVSKNTALWYFSFDQNKIKGSGMDALVESLPNVSESSMYVIYNENEGNVMTTVQVAAAKAKGWTPYYYDGEDWWEYAGSDPSGIEELKNSKVEGLKYYDLQGRRVVNPTKGVYILNGRKVVIK